MKLELSLREDETGLDGTGPVADAAIVIHNEPQAVRLDGIVVRQSRPGWIAIDLPLLDAWQEPLRRLPAEQRERVASPAFYDRLRQHLGDRFLALVSGG